MAETTAVVVIGGLPINKSVAKYLPKHDFVVAADSGLHSAIDLGLLKHRPYLSTSQWMR